jgi:hypothetical protein
VTDHIIDVEPIEESAGKALATLSDYVPEIRRTPEQVKVAIENVESLVREHMREKVDFGTIPGTPKPSLYKAGAERLARFFGLGAVVEQTRSVENWDDGFVLYQYKVGVGPITQDGVVPIAWCEASANSKEKKYVNKPVYDVANTLMKMAEKRAYVGAVLMATNTSDFFSQDLEDLPKEMFQEERQQPKPASSGKPEDMVLTFGKYKGQTLGEIAAENDTYLPWLKGQLEKKQAEGKLPDDQLPLKDAVEMMVGA